MRHIKRYPEGTLMDCPMCDGNGSFVRDYRRSRRLGCSESNPVRIRFECMLCEGKKIIDAAIARDYILERLERMRKFNLATIDVLDD